MSGGLTQLALTVKCEGEVVVRISEIGQYFKGYLIVFFGFCFTVLSNQAVA